MIIINFWYTRKLIDFWLLLFKVISVDGTFLKGRYGGVLLLATAQDANQQIYPLAFAIVDRECDDSYDFFFYHIHKFVPDTEEQLFISDRHMSIKNGIAKHYTKASHGVCMYHLKGNIKKKSTKNIVQQMFVDAARCYRKDKCLQLFENIKMVCLFWFLLFSGMQSHYASGISILVVYFISGIVLYLSFIVFLV